MPSYAFFPEKLNLNTAIAATHHTSPFTDHFDSVAKDSHDVIEGMEDAIALATSDLGLLPGVVFQARVLQLAHLALAHKTVCALCTLLFSIWRQVLLKTQCAGLVAVSNASFQIVVVGPPACGKSECIKTFAIAERQRGKTVNVQSVFTKAVESEELLGHWDPKKRLHFGPCGLYHYKDKPPVLREHISNTVVGRWEILLLGFLPL